MAKSYNTDILDIDGGRYGTPADSVEAALLNGMVDAQAEATRTRRGSIAWTEVTDRFAKGHYVNTGARVLVRWNELPFAANEELDAWLDDVQPARILGLPLQEVAV